MSDKHPLADMLDLAVPLRIMMLQARGGPTDTDWELVQMYGVNGLQHADELLFGGSGKIGDAPREFSALAQAIAVLAFLPGGVTLFGRHYESKCDG